MVQRKTLNQKFKMVTVKVHTRSDGQVVVACCDSALLGEYFEEGNRQLDLKSDFYQGQERDDIEAADIMRNADVINAVGKKCIKIVLDEGLAEKEDIMRIDNIPFVQISLL